MRYVLVVLGLALLVYLVMDFNSRTAELSRLRADKEVVQAQHDSLEATVTALNAQMAVATSDSAVQQWAYENHMARPGDVPVVPVEPLRVTPTPAPRPVVKQLVVTNLERWLALFIDSPTP